MRRTSPHPRKPRSLPIGAWSSPQFVHPTDFFGVINLEDVGDLAVCLEELDKKVLAVHPLIIMIAEVLSRVFRFVDVSELLFPTFRREYQLDLSPSRRS